jgi:riboflavin synthase
MHRIGVVDTMFARFDMGAEALDELTHCPGHGKRFELVRHTVPGFKDLAVQAKRMIEDESCKIVVALGMPNTPILEVFVHEDEAEDPIALAEICRDRARKHARNAFWMLYEPDQLTRRAGKGIRQGSADAGPLVSSGR